MCSWVNHVEAVCCTEDQNSFGKDEDISEEVEVIEICSKMSKEYEMNSNIRLTSIVQDITDIEDIVTLMRKDEFLNKLFGPAYSLLWMHAKTMIS